MIGCSFPCITSHEVLCIDSLWLNAGVEKVGHRADPPADISELIWDF